MKRNLLALFIVLCWTLGANAENPQLLKRFSNPNDRQISHRTQTGDTSGACGENLTWSFDSSTGALVITGSGAMYDFEDIYEEYTYTWVGCTTPWYNYIESITSVSLPQGITTIGQNAFIGCSLLTTITIPNSVTSIGDYAFNGCSSLFSITIPNSITSIGALTFYECSGLDAPVYNNHVFAYMPTSYSGVYTIPEGIESIAGGAFANCTDLTSVTIPNSVTYIGTYAFYVCSSLTSVTIPNSVTSIAYGAFYGCSGLTSIEIPNSVTYIGGSAFDGCTSLTTVTINSNAIVSAEYTYGMWIIFGRQVTNYIIGNDVTNIGEKAFYGCSSLTSVTIPNSVTSIAYGAFYGCSGLTSIEIPNSVTYIGGSAFRDCSGLISLTIPEGIESIKDGAFAGCSGLANPVYNNHFFAYMPTSYSGAYTIPEGIESIVGSAFANCTGLTSVIIPNSVTYIGSSTFAYCSGLTSVTIPNSVTIIGASVFSGCSGLTSIEIPNTVTYIGSYAFYDCTGLTSLTIPNSVTYIGEGAFDGCTGMTSIEIPNSVTYIGMRAFVGCTGLTSVTIPNSVTSIGEETFSGCIGLTSVTIGNSVTSIGERAFYDCTDLTSVAIGNSVTSIGKDAFGQCFSLTSVHISDIAAWCNISFDYEDGYIDSNPLSWAEHLFLNDTEITELRIPDGVASIGMCAFYGCASLTSVIIPNSVTYIGSSTFAYCFGLTSVTIPNSVISIGEEPFAGCSSLTDIYVDCGDIERMMQLLNNDNRVKHSPIPYAITAYADHGSVTTNINNELTVCDSVTCSVNSDYGYHFAQWSDGNTDNPRTITLTQDTTFTAEFVIDKSGTCGKDNVLTWSYDDQSKTLTITGNGELTENYTYGLEAPTQTERLIIAEGVTTIGNNAFADMCSTITSLALSSTVAEIGDSAFAGLNNRKFNKLVLPNDIRSIGAHAFDGASYLKTIYFGSALEEIGELAFNGCTRVQEMTCLAEITPNVGAYGLASISSLATLYVPSDYLFDYQIDTNWSRFVLKTIGTTETTVTNDEVTVVPAENTAEVTWPVSTEASSYTLEITKDGVTFCTLVFNADGQLTGIAFAPDRDNSSYAPAAVQTANGMMFTVTGLNSGTNYSLSLVAKNAAQQMVASYQNTFTTIGVATSLDQIDSSSLRGADRGRLILRNGQVYILRGDRTYTLTGAEVK